MSRGLYITEDIQCLVYTLCRFCAVSAFVSHNTLVHKAGFLCTCTSLRRLHNGEGGVMFLGLVWPINASAYRPLPTRRRNHRRHYSYYWPWPTAADRPVVKVVMCRTWKGGCRRVRDSGRLPRTSLFATTRRQLCYILSHRQNIGNTNLFSLEGVCTLAGVSRNNPHLERVSRPSDTMPTHRGMASLW